MFNTKFLKIIILFSIISTAFSDCPYSKAACDFDLPYVEEMITQLPNICQEIWNKRESDCKDVFQKTVKESKLYSDIVKKLNDIEMQNPNPNSTIPHKNWTLRATLYKNANLYECSNNTVYPTSDEYYECMITKRTNMLTELNNS